MQAPIDNAREVKKKAAEKHNKQFLENYREALQNWYDKHGKQTNPPIFKDDDGKYFWANRKMRRRLEKNK